MYKLLLFISIGSIIRVNCVENFEKDFQTKIIKGYYHRNIVDKVDANKEFIIRFPNSTSKYPYVVYASSQLAHYGHPVFIVVRQQQTVTSWELPLPVESKSGVIKFTSTSRTLCHNSMPIISELPRSIVHQHNSGNTNIPGIHKELTMSIASTSNVAIEFSVRVEEEENFYVEEDKSYFVTISPSEPRFFYYKFAEKNDDKFINTVILEVDSDDDICLTVSVQEPSCPVSDLDNDIWLQGKYQTVVSKGGIIIKEKEYPNGFFIVFVAKGDNYACSREKASVIPLPKAEVIKPLNRSSSVLFSVKPGISKDDYVVASLSTLGAVLIFYLLFSLTTWAFYRWLYRVKVVQQDIPLQNVRDTIDASTRDEEFISVDDIDARLASRSLMLTDLARKKEEYIEKKSYAYLWHVVSIAIFYGIPVVQLVITYQRVLNISGNQDICYYNFLCAHPLFGLSDFNHIYSNIGYGLVGILFLLITFYKQHYVLHNPSHGIPKHYGLFYAMGVALIMEGVLSACYHICPNQSNFQFDTSFMYVMATLCIIKLYQNRHPDINATAYVTFVVLGFAIFAAMVGILNGHITFWIIFIIFYIVLCIYVSFNIYFLSYVKRGVQGIVDEWTTDHDVLKAIEPKRKAHFALLVAANVLNVIFAHLGILCYIMDTDFATFLLGLLMANAILYMIVYIIMKLVHHEKLCLQAAVFGILGLATWIGATYFFVNNSTMWTVTPAESRKYNKHCVMLDFYDFHDIWHMLSAGALFFSFMLLLSLDDDLVNTSQSKIVVF
ncbi:hypothetical protein ILUMI_07968 [Ignelater luminosus]|uniref:Uncharacterized protein n=1 Tax=Ignelater luminosus TaxID=2038154 RepID=A0A8K0D779_IGNLU|nr:hypothetical protein ILUMI_07968 [Ignelater luminosus]